MEYADYSDILDSYIVNQSSPNWMENIRNVVFYKEEIKGKKVKNKSKQKKIPLWEKMTLTLEEAAEYSGIGIHKIRQLTDMKNCDFVLWNGNRRLIKRKKFDEYIDKSYSI